MDSNEIDEAAPTGLQALAGVRVLDFTQVLMGPSATLLLADFGADVVKVERPGRGDLFRWSVLEGDPAGPDNPVFASVNRNKRSIALDLRTEAGSEVVHRLAASADVVVHNFRPGVMARLGLDYECLRERNPGLVFAEGTGFGATAPTLTRVGRMRWHPGDAS